MKKLVIGVAISALALMTTTAFAADAAASSGSKIAIVQVAKILQDSDEVKTATANLKKEFAKEKADIEAGQKKLQAAMEKLKKDDAVMSKKDKEAAQKKIAADRQALVGRISAFQQKVSAKQSEVMKHIFDSLNLTIQAYADANGIDAVFDSQNAIYANDTVDITDPVETAFSAETSKK